MTTHELKTIYVSAASRSRCTPQRTEEGEWKRAFEYDDARDLESALDVFFSNASRSGKGVWMPKVDELRPLRDNARRLRDVSNAQSRAFVAWKCPECRCTRSGWIDPLDQEPRYCNAPPRKEQYNRGEICGARLVVVLREEVTA